jgi:hypothetical protein
VIFLDVDGVLNCYTTPGWDGTILTGLDRQMVRNFLFLVARSGADVVLSSSWRHVPDLCTYLGELGISWVDTTEIMMSDSPRSSVIQKWLDENPGIGRFVVIDDEDGANTAGGLFIHTDPRVGLTVSDVRAAIDYLGGSRSPADEERVS